MDAALLASLQEKPRHFLDEQRHAAGALGDAIDHVLCQHVVRRKVADHMPHLIAVERRERNRAVVRAHPPGQPEFWACADEDNQRRQRAAFGDAAQHVERARIGPMQVFQREHHRLKPGAGDQDRSQRAQLPAPQVLWRQSRHAFLWQRNGQQCRKQRDILDGVEFDLCQRALQLRDPLLRRHVGAAEALTAPFGDRVQRRVLQELRTAPFDPGMRGVAQPRLEFLHQPRLAQARLANDQHQLPVAPPRTLPAPQQHGELLVTTDQRRETALPRAASDTARPHQAEQGHRLRHAAESVTAALLGDEQAGDLPQHPRRHHDLARLGGSLRAGRDVRHVAENLAGFDHHRPPVDRDARGQRWLARAYVLAIQLRD